jgi:hypothetical protein
MRSLGGCSRNGAGVAEKRTRHPQSAAVTVLIKLAYAAAVAALLVLLVAFGVRAFYEGPEEPRFPQPPLVIRPPVIVPTTTTGEPGTPVVVTPTPEELARYEQEQRDFQREFERYEDRREDYRRNVFLIAAAFGIVAIAGGAALWSRIDAVSLGFIAGGFATLLYGVIQAGDDLGEVSPALIFVVALIGLALVLGAGYRWLSDKSSKEG